MSYNTQRTRMNTRTYVVTRQLAAASSVKYANRHKRMHSEAKCAGHVYGHATKPASSLLHKNSSCIFQLGGCIYVMQHCYWGLFITKCPDWDRGTCFWGSIHRHLVKSFLWMGCVLSPNSIGLCSWCYYDCIFFFVIRYHNGFDEDAK